MKVNSPVETDWKSVYNFKVSEHPMCVLSVE